MAANANNTHIHNTHIHRPVAADAHNLNPHRHKPTYTYRYYNKIGSENTHTETERDQTAKR